MRLQLVIPSAAAALEAAEPAPDVTRGVVPDDVLARLRDGDPAEVAAVYDAHHAAVRGFAQRFIGDPALAEDLVHETFLALPKALRRFRNDAPLRSFLIGVALNHARHHVRAAARRRAAMDRLAHHVDDVGAQARRPDDELQRRRLAQALWTALDALPMDQRVAFVLCEVEERSSIEVAAIVGASEGTVRSRLFHAKRKLREALDGDGDDGGAR